MNVRIDLIFLGGSMLKDKRIINLILAIFLLVFITAMFIVIKNDSSFRANLSKSQTSDSKEGIIVDYNRWYSIKLSDENKQTILLKRESQLDEPMSIDVYYKKMKPISKIASIEMLNPKDWKNDESRKIIGIMKKNGKRKIVFVEYKAEEINKLNKGESNKIKLIILKTIKDNLKVVDGTTLENGQKYTEELKNEIRKIENSY